MRLYFLSAIAIVLFNFNALSQGCSDAGFCTMGAMQPSQVYTKKVNFKLRALALDYYHGQTTLSPEIRALTADFTFGINEGTSVQVKLPYMWVSGNFGDNQGLGDISLSLTKNLYSTEKFHINATIGTKIPTNKSDQEIETEILSDGVTSADLPMYYQTSLGSYDFIAGGALISKKWMFGTGVQVALTENENQFRLDEWLNYSSDGYRLRHDEGINLKRGTDIMFRVERAFLFSKFDFRVGMLPIIRVTQDEVEDATSGERVKLDGTTGLALSAIAGAAYHFSTKNTLRLTYGLKIDDRDVNPDGLTRDWIFSAAYVIRF